MLKPSSDESVELRRDENVRGSAEPPRAARKRTPSEMLRNLKNIIQYRVQFNKFGYYTFPHRINI